MGCSKQAQPSVEEAASTAPSIDCDVEDLRLDYISIHVERLLQPDE